VFRCASGGWCVLYDIICCILGLVGLVWFWIGVFVRVFVLFLVLGFAIVTLCAAELFVVVFGFGVGLCVL